MAEPLAEVAEALLGEGVVVVLPRELGLDVAARGQGLASLDDLYFDMSAGVLSYGGVLIGGGTDEKVLGVNLLVLGEVEVLLGHEDTLTEEVLVDELAVGLGNEPDDSRISQLCSFLVSYTRHSSPALPPPPPISAAPFYPRQSPALAPRPRLQSISFPLSPAPLPFPQLLRTLHIPEADVAVGDTISRPPHNKAFFKKDIGRRT